MLKNLRDWDVKYGLEGFPYLGWTLLTLWEWALSHKIQLPNRFPAPPAYLRKKSTKGVGGGVEIAGQKREKILKIAEVAAKIKCSRAHIYVLIKKNEFFPKSISLGGKNRGWRESEVDEWLRGKSF